MIDPRLSLVIPTTGTDGSVIRSLESIVHGLDPHLLSRTELIVYLNRHPEVHVDLEKIESYLKTLVRVFQSVDFKISDTLHLTAEASACAASAFAKGEYIWIVGDKRIFLPEGLRQLAKFLDAPPAPCAYFNSVRHDRNGYTNEYSSTFLSENLFQIPYKRLVQKIGINFMSTNMGTWIFPRKYLDAEIWKGVMQTCGPHFSHVTTLLATMGETQVVCYSVHLTILELKPYHLGGGNEWQRYAEIAKVYLYYPWTFGLVRQFQFLIDRGAYTYSDVRRSICSEAGHLARQIDEIYVHFFQQIQLGWEDKKQHLTVDEFSEILTFLTLACPERVIINGLLEKMYKRASNDPPNHVKRVSRPILQAIALDNDGVRLGSLIVGQVGDRFIRLHPDGYLCSKVSDNVQFALAYKLIDVPATHRYWQLIKDDDLYELGLKSMVPSSASLMPAYVDRNMFNIRERKYKRILRKYFRPAHRLVEWFERRSGKTGQ